ncbi:MAG: hypothetical protein ACJAWS_000724 [Oleiphilaceae bacterium]|jgi:hypothetical protein
MVMLQKLFILLVINWLILLSGGVFAGGKLVGSSGVTQIEGSGGGGIVPWATLAGSGTRDEVSGSAFFSAVSVDDFRMSAYGVSYAFRDRVEVSVAHQEFRSDDKTVQLAQNVLGMKVRLFGDLVYTPWPQVALGAQYKNASSSNAIRFLGAKKDHGVDYYLAVTKAWLDGPLHRTFVLNTTLRYSKANQLGLLGFGGDKQDGYLGLLEASAVIFVTRHWALGAEYRQKPNQLNAIKEDDWKDLFVTYIPNKKAALSFAVVDLGRIGGRKKQTGGYLSLQIAY